MNYFYEFDSLKESTCIFNVGGPYFLNLTGCLYNINVFLCCSFIHIVFGVVNYCCQPCCTLPCIPASKHKPLFFSIQYIYVMPVLGLCRSKLFRLQKLNDSPQTRTSQSAPVVYNVARRLHPSSLLSATSGNSPVRAKILHVQLCRLFALDKHILFMFSAVGCYVTHFMLISEQYLAYSIKHVLFFQWNCLWTSLLCECNYLKRNVIVFVFFYFFSVGLKAVMYVKK